MRWLLYRSLPTVSPWPATILDIARIAERRNSALGVSGQLLFAADCYLQFLEGEATALAGLWESIRADPRHSIVWKQEGIAPGPRLAGLPLGYLDADREPSCARSLPLWAKRHDWPASDAPGLVELLVAAAEEKYPLALGLARRSRSGAAD
jgi:hypothetical protein